MSDIVQHIQKMPVTLDYLPDTVRPGFEDIAPTDTVVVEHICLDQNLCGVMISCETSMRTHIRTFVYQAAKSTSFFTPMAI
jgi:hypothetical protein